MIIKGLLSVPSIIFPDESGSRVLLVRPVGEKYQYCGYLASSGGRYFTEGDINLRI